MFAYAKASVRDICVILFASVHACVCGALVCASFLYVLCLNACFELYICVCSCNSYVDASEFANHSV